MSKQYRTRSDCSYRSSYCSSLIRVYTVWHCFYIFWTRIWSIFRIITAIISGVPTFTMFTVVSTGIVKTEPRTECQLLHRNSIISTSTTGAWSWIYKTLQNAPQNRRKACEHFGVWTRDRNLSSGACTHHMSHVTRKPVFGVCDQLRLKLACSADETS